MSNDENDDKGTVFPGVEEEKAPELIERYLDADKKPRPELWRIGVDELNTINTAPALVWREVGPNPLNNLPNAAIFQGNQPVGGEVTDIAIDPSGTTDSTIYVATNNGGIWKTTDGGNTWFPASDTLPSLSIGAVALDPANPSIVYAGSGNLFDGSGGFIKAAGLYKSVDAGRTWFVADGGVFGSTFQGIGINRIVCPAADSLLVGTKNGLYRSINGGLNFGANAGCDDGKPVLPGFVTALAMDADPANPNIAWVGIRGLNDVETPGQPATVFPGGGLFRLTLNPDGTVSSASKITSVVLGVQFGSIAFAQASPPNSQTIYANAQGQDNQGKPVFLDLYVSTDGGGTWNRPLGAGVLKNALQAVATPTDREDNQSAYDFTLGVDPQNPNLIYAGFKRIWSSANAGANFIQSSQAYGNAQVHWDQHELVFSPKSHWGPAGVPTDVWVGSDGGVARHRVVQVTMATNASPIVITAANHGFLTGNRVTISGVNGNTAANNPPNAPWVITVIDQNSFSLADINATNSTGNGAYTNGGTAEAWTQLNAGARTHLFFGIDIGRGAAANQQFTYAGTQDNGTPGRRSGDPGASWVAGIDGDGGMTAVDPADPKIVYGFDDELTIKTTDQGQSWVTSSDQNIVSISGATNAAPIVITATGHFFQTDDQVAIRNVQGNTAANSPPKPGGKPGELQKRTVTVIDANNFSLNGSSGVGALAYVAGSGEALGQNFGRRLQNSAGFIRRVALVPNGNVAATTLYVSEGQDLWKSTDGGSSFAKDVFKHFDHFVFAIVCPDANRIWVGTGDGNVHFSNDAGASWKDFSPGPTTPVTGIAVDPADVTRVAVVYAGFSGMNRAYPTQHCFLSTNEGADWKDISATDPFAFILNLPDLPLHSVVFDSSTTPSTIVVASDAAVLQRANSDGSWQILGAGLPRTTCRSLAIDNTAAGARSPRLLRLGTYGRSCFELVRLTGPRLIVTANIAFGAVQKGKTPFLDGTLFNVGDAPVTFTSFAKTAGDPDFDFDGPTDLSPLAPGAIRVFGIKFTASANGIHTAIFTLQTNDAVNPSIQIPVSGITCDSGKPRLAVKASFQFGEVQRGDFRSIRFNINNTGLGDLVLSQLALTSNGEFSLGAPTSLTLAAGDGDHFDVTYTPNVWGGESKTTLRIVSNDPRQPTLEIPVTGSAPYNSALLIALIVLGAAVIAGGVGLAAYEASKKH